MGTHAPQSPADSSPSHLRFSLVAPQAVIRLTHLSWPSAIHPQPNLVTKFLAQRVARCCCAPRESCGVGWGNNAALSLRISCSSKSLLLWKGWVKTELPDAQIQPPPYLGRGGPVSPVCSGSFPQGMEGPCARSPWCCVFALPAEWPFNLRSVSPFSVSETSLPLRDLTAPGFPPRGQCYFCCLRTK